MMPAIQKLREDCLRRGWTITEWFDKDIRAFVTKLSGFKKMRPWSATMNYSHDEIDMAHYAGDILLLRWTKLVKDVEEGLATIR